jgi:hypothetical protein
VFTSKNSLLGMIRLSTEYHEMRHSKPLTPGATFKKKTAYIKGSPPVKTTSVFPKTKSLIIFTQLASCYKKSICDIIFCFFRY